MNTRTKITEVYRIYNWRKGQIIELFAKVHRKARDNKISLGARNLEEADIMFEGYIKKNDRLLTRLVELESEVTYITSVFGEGGFWTKIFGWLPWIYVNKDIHPLMDNFIKKWSEYEPGW